VAGHSHLRLPADEPGDFAGKSQRLAGVAKIAAGAGLVLALILGFIPGDEFKRFFYSYLAAWGFFLAISLGAIFFVLTQHVSRAGWSVNVRRVAEMLAALMPALSILSLPIFVAVLMHRGDLYRWALPMSAAEPAETRTAEHPSAVKDEKHELAASKEQEELASTAGNQQIDPVKNWKVDEEFRHEQDPGPGKRHIDEIMLKKRVWLNPWFFCLRLVIYLGLWSWISVYYLKQSTLQDADGDYRHTSQMQKYSGVSLVFYGLTLTLAAWDLFMSLDAHWFSTMFGVYYFAGGVVSFFAALILIISLLQRAGFLKEAVTIEHYHDMGKYLFAFTFFWGYVSFAQYMLIWYSSIPEEVTWWARRGAKTGGNVPSNGQNWIPWAVMVLFCCLLIPFAGLLSRHVKRNTKSIVFWAVWQLMFQFTNVVWIVLPELRELSFPWMALIHTIVAAVGIGGVLVLAWLKLAGRSKLRPVNDPRVFESAAFVNM